MTGKETMDDAALEAFFDAAREAADETPPALMAAVLEAAEREQPKPRPLAARRTVTLSPPGFFAEFLAGLGGWRAAAALAAFAVVGLAIGVSERDSIGSLASGLTGATGDNLSAGFDMTDLITGGDA